MGAKSELLVLISLMQFLRLKAPHLTASAETFLLDYRKETGAPASPGRGVGGQTSFVTRESDAYMHNEFANCALNERRF